MTSSRACDEGLWCQNHSKWSVLGRTDPFGDQVEREREKKRVRVRERGRGDTKHPKSKIQIPKKEEEEKNGGEAVKSSG